MGAYIVRRLLLMIPTLLGIMLLNFVIVQFAPGGPVERVLSELRGHNADATSRLDSAASTVSAPSAVSEGVKNDSIYRGRQGVEEELIEQLNHYYGFDKPAYERFITMMWNYVRFDFGESYYRDETVIGLIAEKMPVSISLGLWTTLLVYLISIPLGIKKAVRHGSSFDIWTSTVIIIGYAIPGFMFAILLIVLFAGGNYFDIFPIRGLVSENWDQLPWYHKVADYFWHLTLPVVSMVIGGFASLTMLTKNSFLEEINKQYVLTARAKGLAEKSILYKHVFRNAMLIVISGFPSALLSILFTGSLLIEVIFSLDGLGLLGFEAAINRDYPLVMGTLFIFTLLGLIMGLIGDLMYVWIDPRIDFEASNT